MYNRIESENILKICKIKRKKLKIIRDEKKNIK